MGGNAIECTAMSLKHIRIWLAVGLLTVSPALSATNILNVVVENDAFARTDRYYSSGMLISWLRTANAAPDSAHQLANWLAPDYRRERLQWSLALAQEIYTPEDIEASPAPADDRPYAGYLYGTAQISIDQYRYRDSWHLSLGIVGPSSRADRMQERLHEQIKSDLPQGWDDQLRDEFIVNAGVERQWIGLPKAQGDQLQIDLLPHLGGAVGNLMTYLNAGFIIRLGSGLTDDYGPPRLRPNLPQGATYARRSDLRWYVYLGADGRYMARNLFLDGNTRKSSPSVERKPWVLDSQIGAVFMIGAWRLNYSYVLRSKEYVGQDYRARFGSLSLAYQF